MKTKKLSCLFCLLMAFVILFSTAPSAFAAEYKDVASNSQYRTAINYVTEHGLMVGSKGNLKPAGPMTRSMMVTALMFMRFMQNIVPDATETPSVTAQSEVNSESTGEKRMRITVGDTVLTATLADNETARAIADMLPLTLPLMDLYGREMCYRFTNELPANEVHTRNFQLGEIIYWPPRHSFVIMYNRDGEQFDMQHVGQIDSGVEIFNQTGDVEVTFELINE
nr:cyclophilin-like fold protein [uncultured Clostridium sp.]